MKTSLLKITAPVLAGNEEGVVDSSLLIEEQASIEQAVEPIENKVFAVTDETAAITEVWKSKNALTLEEYRYYQQRLTSIFNRLGEARQNITAVSDQYGDGSLHIAGVGVAITASLAVALDTREQLEAVSVQAETA